LGHANRAEVTSSWANFVGADAFSKFGDRQNDFGWRDGVIEALDPEINPSDRTRHLHAVLSLPSAGGTSIFETEFGSRISIKRFPDAARFTRTVPIPNGPRNTASQALLITPRSAPKGKRTTSARQHCYSHRDSADKATSRCCFGARSALPGEATTGQAIPSLPFDLPRICLDSTKPGKAGWVFTGGRARKTSNNTPPSTARRVKWRQRALLFSPFSLFLAPDGDPEFRLNLPLLSGENHGLPLPFRGPGERSSRISGALYTPALSSGLLGEPLYPSPPFLFPLFVALSPRRSQVLAPHGTLDWAGGGHSKGTF